MFNYFLSVSLTSRSSAQSLELLEAGKENEGRLWVPSMLQQEVGEYVPLTFANTAIPQFTAASTRAAVKQPSAEPFWFWCYGDSSSWVWLELLCPAQSDG